jgi:tetratricopeptide (TPR) repeat protein
MSVCFSPWMRLPPGAGPDLAAATTGPVTRVKSGLILRRRLALGLALAAALPLTSFAHGDFEQRHKELTAALALEPGNAALHYELAGVYCIDGHTDWKQARAELDAAEQLAPGRFPVDLLRGKIGLASGRPREALEALQRHVLARPADFEGYQQRARAWRALGDDEACVADYRTALRLAPRATAALIRETAEALAGSGRAEEAVELLAGALQQLGSVPSLVRQALELELATGHFDAALTRADTMRKIWPLPEPWHAKRAVILARAGRLEEARAEWRALLAHIDALPPTRRDSEAVKLVAAEARAALAAPPLAATTTLSQLQTPTPEPVK